MKNHPKKSPQKKSTPKKTRLYIHGINGRMGRELVSVLKDTEHSWDLINEPRDSLATSLAKAQVIIDFSSPSGSQSLLQAIEETLKKKAAGKALLICTTGLSKSFAGHLQKLSKSYNFRSEISANTSLAVNVFARMLESYAAEMASYGYDFHLVETHHKRKKDAPSGTALMLAQRAASKTKKRVVPASDSKSSYDSESIAVHAVRGGGVFGEHEFRFIGEDDELTIKHRAFSRRLFAVGALRKARHLFDSTETA